MTARWIRAAWLGVWRLAQRYHRYEVEGFEHLGGPAALLVGYHGRGGALDLCMLTATVHDRLGYLPHGIIHSFYESSRLFRPMVDALGFVPGDGPKIVEAVARGEHVLVEPGGNREGLRSFRQRYRVAWGDRIGYVRLAVRHGLRIIPIAGHGMDDTYLGLNDGYALGKRLGLPHRLPLWFGIGIGVWPLALPFPVKVKQVIGPPVDPAAEGAHHVDDQEALVRVHRKVVGVVQGLLDKSNRVR
ncbi:MAG TPA: lysophospholipid acyltransferase family protein [Candidatus Xenobia bacterium]